MKPRQPVQDAGARGAIASGVAGIVAVVVYAAGVDPVVNVLLTPTCVMVGFVLGGVYDQFIRK